MVYRNGVDRILRKPNTSNSEQCRICGSDMYVERDKNVYTSYACAMAKKSSCMDAFYCPHSDKEWHDKAGKLIDEIDDTTSPSIKEIIQKDLENVLKDRS